MATAGAAELAAVKVTHQGSDDDKENILTGFKISGDPSTRQPRQHYRCATQHSNRAYFVGYAVGGPETRREGTEVRRWSGAHHSRVEGLCGAAVDALVVEECSVAPPSGEVLVPKGVVNVCVLDDPFLNVRENHPREGHSVGEVGGAVDWVTYPETAPAFKVINCRSRCFNAWFNVFFAKKFVVRKLSKDCWFDNVLDILINLRRK